MAPSPRDPEGGTATGRCENRSVLGGDSVVQDYTRTRGGKTTFEGHGVFGDNAEQDCSTLHGWDSMGFSPNV